ncbi:MAG TPA: P1 family peptidase [Gemmatimonadales bacterium]|jgi:D-aminopeptidase|nr:P1 family peptidase [Gemmatimonadales bacterium]
MTPPGLAVSLALTVSLIGASVGPLPAQVRARAVGVAPGVFPPGPRNAITDVSGVRVGHATVDAGDSIHTGVTAILPHGGNLFLERVPAAIRVGNGFGKLLGVTQVRELGELETPILLTCTLCVWKAADALVAWLLEQPGMERVRSINPVVGETNDGGLNAIRLRPIGPAEVRAALAAADTGAVAEGSVGAGRGTRAFCWKGGIGTASRVLPRRYGGWIVGVLVQSNFGGLLQVAGAPVGRELGCDDFREAQKEDQGDGSIMVVVATDAPLLARNLERLAARALSGVARTGSYMDNGSGDYVIAFSTAPGLRRPFGERRPAAPELENEELGPLFQAVVEATEEAIYNSLFMATPVRGRERTVEPVPLHRVREILARYRAGGR